MVRINIYITDELKKLLNIHVARHRGFNVSAVCSEALSKAIGVKQPPSLLDLEQRLERLERKEEQK